MADSPTPGRQLRDELLSLATVAVAAIVVDPVLRRNTRVRLQAALRSVKDTIGPPAPRQPTPREVSSLHDEARRITREAARDA